MNDENPIPKLDPEPDENMTVAGGSEATLDSVGGGTGSVMARKSIGPYALIRVLGEGGMGQVWLAQQTAPVKRQVALKLIKGGLYDNRVLQRFDAERQSLAVMNHPTIAKIYDAGTTPDGQPYFVMEYVDGPSVTRYCDIKKLRIRQRLELFIKVCDGVQHAHQKAIIHRDLKPSNVLVEEVDGEPVPRIIDFGIAKAITSEAGGERALVTRVGALIGTPGFISPEQADPGVLDVDTRTDVYSLGVILYVLLTGTLPFSEDEWTNQPIDEVLRQLRQEDPPRPSAKLGSENRATTEIAARRSSDQQELVSQLRGDLDWVAMKALEKDRVRRYGTPSELAADVERYLTNQPVTARRASAGYRLQKYVQRHRLGVAVATGVAVLLAAFTIVQAVQLRRITHERDRANRITGFMTNMFKVSDPSESRGNSITVREVLDKASKDIDTGLAKDPELQSDLLATMASTYLNLGLYKRAQELYGKALDIQRGVLGLSNPKTLFTMSIQGFILERQGRYVESEKLLRETLELQTHALGPENASTLATLSRLGNTLASEGQFVEAEKIQRHALEIRRRTLSPDDDAVSTSMDNLGNTLESAGHYAEAEKLQRAVIETELRLHGEEYPFTLRELSNLATTLEREGKYAEAETIQRRALGLQLHVLDPQHPSILISKEHLATILLDEDHYTDAETMYREVITSDRSVWGPNHPYTLHNMEMLGLTLAYEKQFPEAEKLFQEAIDIASKAHGQVGLSGAWYNFACAAAVAGHRDEALHHLREAIDRRYGSAKGIASDSDLKSLHSDPRFDALIEQVRKRDAAPQTQ